LNDSILDMHTSGNDSKCSAQEPYLYLVMFFELFPFDWFYRAVLVRSITLSP